MLDLHTADNQGVTKQQSITSVIKQLRRAGNEQKALELEQELKLPKVKVGSERLLGVFNDLNTTRQQGFNGPCAITYQEIKTYCELMEETLTPWEIEVIRHLDNVFLDSVNKHNKAKESVK